MAYVLFFYGRGEKIRTSDPQHPMLVRYQAALRPDEQRGGLWSNQPLMSRDYLHFSPIDDALGLPFTAEDSVRFDELDLQTDAEAIG